MLLERYTWSERMTLRLVQAERVLVPPLLRQVLLRLVQESQHDMASSHGLLLSEFSHLFSELCAMYLRKAILYMWAMIIWFTNKYSAE